MNLNKFPQEILDMIKVYSPELRLYFAYEEFFQENKPKNGVSLASNINPKLKQNSKNNKYFVYDINPNYIIEYNIKKLTYIFGETLNIEKNLQKMSFDFNEKEIRKIVKDHVLHNKEKFLEIINFYNTQKIFLISALIKHERQIFNVKTGNTIYWDYKQNISYTGNKIISNILLAEIFDSLILTSKKNVFEQFIDIITGHFIVSGTLFNNFLNYKKFFEVSNTLYTPIHDLYNEKVNIYRSLYTY
jgi:hypothetical protein